MRIICTGFLYLALSYFLSISVQAKEWREINPMKSTRSDVIRILGESEFPNSYRAVYHLKEGDIKITFTNVINEVSGNKNLPDDIVCLITFQPKPNFPLADLELDLTTYKKFDPAIPRNSGYECYINKYEGLAVITRNGNVRQVDYFPDNERQKLCPHCYDFLESVRIIIN